MGNSTCLNRERPVGQRPGTWVIDLPPWYDFVASNHTLSEAIVVRQSFELSLLHCHSELRSGGHSWAPATCSAAALLVASGPLTGELLPLERVEKVSCGC